LVVYVSCLSVLCRVLRYIPGIASKRRKFGWARAIPATEIRRLSSPAQLGLYAAQEIAQNAEERRLHGLSNPPARRTLTQVATDLGSSAVEINNGLKQARLELFGKNLSDSAAYNRIRQHSQLGNRTCAHNDCTTPLPRYAHASRRYCSWHSRNHARAERHRAKGESAG
jgi:hypothetical protein